MVGRTRPGQAAATVVARLSPQARAGALRRIAAHITPRSARISERRTLPDATATVDKPPPSTPLLSHGLGEPAHDAFPSPRAAGRRWREAPDEGRFGRARIATTALVARPNFPPQPRSPALATGESRGSSSKCSAHHPRKRPHIRATNHPGCDSDHRQAAATAYRSRATELANQLTMLSLLPAQRGEGGAKRRMRGAFAVHGS